VSLKQVALIQVYESRASMTAEDQRLQEASGAHPSFLKNSVGERQVYAQYPKLQHDNPFRDYINFYEYFDGDTGWGVGAFHQTGWTGLIEKLLHSRAGYTIGKGC
jgi:hypothetical protein